jgi:hypothetical protein
MVLARFIAVALATLGFEWCRPTVLCAQAWISPAGEGTVTVTYENYYITGHFNLQGRKTPNGATHAKTLLAELDYALTDTVGLAVSLPFVSSKYTGPRPSYFVGRFETFPGPLDDGTYHGAFQDVRVELRRMFLRGPFAVTPFIGGAVPTHAYETVGEAVPGRHRPELQLGANAGALLDRLARGAYVHARYVYTTAQREQNLPYRRSNLDLEGGSSITSRVAARALVNWQFAHDAPTQDQLAPIWRIHDRFIVPNHNQIGAGISVSVTPAIELYTLGIATVSGKGGAHIARVLSVGASWRFGRTGLEGL